MPQFKEFTGNCPMCSSPMVMSFENDENMQFYYKYACINIRCPCFSNKVSGEVKMVYDQEIT